MTPSAPTHKFGLAGRFAALLGLILLAGCASTPPWPETAAPAQQESTILDQALLNHVPFYPQEKYQCGPASLATMLNTQGLATDPEILKELVYLPGRQGSLQVEMVAGARSHDMVVYPLKPNLEAVLGEVNAGNPVLIMQNLRFNWWPQWHFAVVVGYDSEEEVLILNTDTRRHYRMPYKVFHATWNRADRWAVVILPPDSLPATAEALPYLRAAHDLESTGHTRAAQQAYQAAEQQWPDQPAPIMAQGNLAYDQGNAEGAASHFLRAVNRFPGFSEGWNNLAYALSARSCPEQASKALACATNLNPERFGQAPELPKGTTGGSRSSCPPVPDCPADTIER
ncbi:PA2778 family cysteine peptidase [Marinobacter alkaliphilus]|uniref:PA2778 family cysteine peptidase n=1 Tax=Marinobacter alkaliphilus TaxID=254719 RepID=A0ABZ3E5G5_9GAMM